ncbi:MAG TPA: sensor histidine kinase [Chthoniobacteraceae bacterium]|jgi:hypothetical protein
MSDPVSLRVLADFLCARRAEITSQWIEQVRAERKIPSADEIPRAQLMDHLPALFDHLADELRGAGREVQAAASHDARAHGEHRWLQQYRLEELLREVSVLRSVFMRHLLAFQAEHPDFIQEVEWQANQIVHSYFDSLATESSSCFVARQQEELHEANRSLDEANLKLQNFNARLVEQDERRLRMLRTISHEVRNHLNAISFVVGILAIEDDPVVCHEHLEMLSRNLVEITGLVDELLDFATLLSGGERAELEVCDPGELYNDVAISLPEMARVKGLAFAGFNDPGIGPVISDCRKLRRIVLNLSLNAIKYTVQGEIRVDFRSGAGDTWHIEVSDTGPGIPAAECQRIFQEFHRVPATTGGQPGAGLGLAITLQLVKLLSGRIEVFSEVGRGTRFCVTLPRAPLKPPIAVL